MKENKKEFKVIVDENLRIIKRFKKGTLDNKILDEISNFEQACKKKFDLKIAKVIFYVNT